MKQTQEGKHTDERGREREKMRMSRREEKERRERETIEEAHRGEEERNINKRK